MTGLFLLSGLVIFVLVVISISFCFENCYNYKYTKGSYRLCPWVNDELHIAGRRRRDGQWAYITKIVNTHTITKTGRRSFECNFKYPTESDWLKAAAQEASLHVNCEQYQNVKIYKEYSYTIIWQNGNWM